MRFWKFIHRGPNLLDRKLKVESICLSNWSGCLTWTRSSFLGCNLSTGSSWFLLPLILCHSRVIIYVFGSMSLIHVRWKKNTKRTSLALNCLWFVFSSPFFLASRAVLNGSCCEERSETLSLGKEDCQTIHTGYLLDTDDRPIVHSFVYRLWNSWTAFFFAWE